MSENISFEDGSDLSTRSKSALKKLTKKQNKLVKNLDGRKKTDHGFMYIGHLPHGFYENEIKNYFAQFGKIVKLRLARSKKTGNHKGYGFIEFADIEVAKIAAETMNNYLMFNKILKCHLIPKEKLHPLTFKNAKKKFFVNLRSYIRKKYNRKRSSEQIEKMKKRQTEKMKKRQDKLKEMGINLDLSKILNQTEKENKIEEKKDNSLTVDKKKSKKDNASLKDSKSKKLKK